MTKHVDKQKEVEKSALGTVKSHLGILVQK